MRHLHNSLLSFTVAADSQASRGGESGWQVWPENNRQRIIEITTILDTLHPGSLERSIGRLTEEGAKESTPASINLSSNSSRDLNLDAIDVIYHSGRCICAGCGGGRPPRNPTSATPSSGGTAASTTSMVSLQTLANYLTTGYWQEAGTYTRKYNLSGSGTGAKSGTITYNITGWANDSNGLAADRQALTREVFKLYSAILGINFKEVTGSGGDIRFTDNDTGAYAYMASGWYADSSRTNVIIDYSVVNVEATWYDGKANYNTYTPQTIFHEIGHALGLGHQGQYNYTGTPLTYDTSAQFANDSWQATMMSYWDQAENPYTGASFAWLQTPMTVDWIALNDLYGGQGFGTANAFRNDTTYGVGTNISSSVSDIWNKFSTYAGLTAYTIVDSGGYDKLDVSNFSANQLINLAASQPGSTTPSLSNIGGKIGNLSIATGTIIEAAAGGSGNDSFYGNNANNTFWGNGGDDNFYDSLGSDVYYGDLGIDSLYFTESIDLFSIQLSGESLLFSRLSDSSNTDQAWKGVENIYFNSTAYTYDYLVANFATNPPPQPTATLSLTGAVNNSINEGSGFSINISTTNLTPGTSIYWRLSGSGITTGDFNNLSSLSGSTATDASGNAVLNLSTRADATTEGDEVMGFAVFSDAGLTKKLADLVVTIKDTSLTPVPSNLTLWGTTGNDVITGGNGNDQLAGVPQTGTTASALGRGQIDTLTGGAGSDRFLLADSRGTFYNDGSNKSQGTSDYALVTDFNAAEDVLQLRSGSQYLYRYSGGNTEIFLGNGDNRFNTSDELIAKLQGINLTPGSSFYFLGATTNWVNFV